MRDALSHSEANDTELAQQVLGNAIKEAEDVIRTGLQRFPNDDRLLTEEANLGEILQNADRALDALKRAAKTNPRSELIARRLARILRAKNQTDEAINVIKTTLDLNPGSSVLHYDLARILIDSAPAADLQNGETILYHLHRSFFPGDKNHDARFWYARQLCLLGRGVDARVIFDELKKLRIPISHRRNIRGLVRNTDGFNTIYHGQIYAMKDLFGFIRSDQDGLEIFFSFEQVISKYDQLTVGTRVKYSLGFNLQGPIAVNVGPI